MIICLILELREPGYQAVAFQAFGIWYINAYRKLALKICGKMEVACVIHRTVIMHVWAYLI